MYQTHSSNNVPRGDTASTIDDNDSSDNMTVDSSNDADKANDNADDTSPLKTIFSPVFNLIRKVSGSETNGSAADSHYQQQEQEQQQMDVDISLPVTNQSQVQMMSVPATGNTAVPLATNSYQDIPTWDAMQQYNIQDTYNGINQTDEYMTSIMSPPLSLAPESVVDGQMTSMGQQGAVLTASSANAGNTADRTTQLKFQIFTKTIWTTIWQLMSKTKVANLMYMRKMMNWISMRKLTHIY